MLVDHVVVQKKTLDRLASQTNERAVHKPSKFGINHLKKLGWNEGDGLGKNRQGMSTHVKVKQKDDVMGVGCKKQNPVVGNVWWTNAFDASLSDIKIPGADSSDDSESDSDSDLDEEAKISLKRDMSTYTEEDKKLFIACGGRRCGKRAGRLQTGKILRELEADKKFKQALVQLEPTKTTKNFHEAAKASVILEEISETVNNNKDGAQTKKKKEKKSKKKRKLERDDSEDNEKAKKKSKKSKKKKDKKKKSSLKK